MSDNAVYEVCDTTIVYSDVSLGVFASLESAIQAISDHIEVGVSVNPYAEGTETISIIERKFGLTERKQGTVMWSMHREEYSAEDIDEYLWRKIES